MKASIISIGDELLIGQILNTNAQWMAKELKLMGIKVEEIRTISDAKKAITQTVDQALEQADICFITGGLGPTKDDITKKTLAEHLDYELVYHEESFENIRQLFSSYNREVDDRYKEQCLMPKGADILINRVGTASGMWMEYKGKIIVSMPGVPREMKYLMQECVFPKLLKQQKRPELLHRTLLTIGKGETDLSEILASFESDLPEYMQLAYLPNTEEGIVRLRLSAEGEDKTFLEGELERAVVRVKELLGHLVFGEGAENLALSVGKILLEKGARVATAESCTGGRIASKFTENAGSSSYYEGSVIAYSNAIKQQILKVDCSILEEHGAVSEACVRAMVKGTLNLLQVDYAIAVSGIAGPGGARPGKPVGTIWVAVGNKERIETKKLELGQYRLRNIQRTTSYALNFLRRFLTIEAY